MKEHKKYLNEVLNEMPVNKTEREYQLDGAEFEVNGLMGLTAQQIKDRLVRAFEKGIAEEFGIDPENVLVGRMDVRRIYRGM